MAKKKEVLAAIDVGTTKICSVVAEVQGETIRILGVGTVPSRGLRKGIVVNLSETIDSIRASLDLAEEQSQTVIESAFVSVGGAYIRGINRRGETEVRSRSGEIESDDIERAVAAATTLDLPADYQVIHILTQNFSVDGQEGVDHPLGMFGKHLSVRLHMVVNASAIVQNIINAVNKANVSVDGVVMQQLASAEATLSQDEKELGAFVVDIGGGTTDIAFYGQDSIWHSEVLAMGSNLLTKDIAIGLKAPIQEAEQLKKEAGSAFPESVPPEEVVEISEVGTGRARTFPRQRLCQVVRARCDEILNAVADVITKAGIDSDLVTGVVLTGGGSLLDGMSDRAEQILEMPVRLGYPGQVVEADSDLFHPAFATALGVLRYAHQVQERNLDFGTPLKSKPRGTGEKFKSWFLEKIG